MNCDKALSNRDWQAIVAQQTEKNKMVWETFYDKYARLDALNLSNKTFDALVFRANAHKKRLCKSEGDCEEAAPKRERKKIRKKVCLGRVDRSASKENRAPRKTTSQKRSTRKSRAAQSTDENGNKPAVLQQNCKQIAAEKMASDSPTPTYKNDFEKAIEVVEVECKSHLKYIMLQRVMRWKDEEQGYSVYHELCKKETRRLMHERNVPKSVMLDYLAYLATLPEIKEHV